MDFLERIFHFSPDGGNGMLEAIVMLSLVLVPVVTFLTRTLPRRKTKALNA